MASPETLGHLEGREKQQSVVERLPIADISKRPESVASALQQSQKANELAGRIVGTERSEQIQQDNPHTKHPDTLSKDPEIAKYQGILYESLGIDKNTNANNIIKKFSKGMIDGLLVGNTEIIMMIKNEGIEKFVNAIKTQFSTLEGIGQVLKALGMSVWDLATGDSYDRGKSLAELGLITTGAGAVGSLSKFAGKTAIRASVKVGGETVARKAVSETLHAVGRTAEVVGTGLQLPAKGVKKVAEGTAKVVGAVSGKTGVSATLRTSARVGNEIYERSGTKKVVEGTKKAIKSTIDTGIKALGATEAIQTVTSKVSSVVDSINSSGTEAVKTSEKYTPEIVSKLGDTERITVVSELLGRSLTQEEKSAIIKAHTLGDGGIGNYSLSDIRGKTDILKQAGFSPEERRVLMEKGVCGTESSLNVGKSLLQESRFNFLNKPEYKELLDLYGGNIDREKLLGEGQNAIILQHPNKQGRVLKVAKEGAHDDIAQEFKNHQTFYETLEQGKIDYPGQLSDNVKIPEVKKGNGDNPIYFEMEKIDGQSFKSLFYREQYATQLEKAYSKDKLVLMSDAELENVVKELGLDPIPSIILASDGGFSRALFNQSQTFMWNKIRDPIRKQENELGNTLSFLHWKGLSHTDMHSGNFMLSRDGKTTYIIDFGNTNLNTKK